MLFLLAFRSLILAIFEVKRIPLRLLDGGLFLLYLFLALLLPVQNMPVIIGASAIIGISLFLRLRRPYAPAYSFRLLKGAAFFGFLILYTLAFSLSACFNLSEDQAVLKVNLTGKTRQEWVEWKNPRGVLKKEPMTAHEVRLETLEGKEIGSYFFLGDQVALKAKVIRFSPLLNALGIKNRCRLDALHNSYSTAERGNLLPVQYEELHHPDPLTEWIWKFWEPLYLQTQESEWIKSATLESNYFPLDAEKSYLLTVNQGGLSSTN